MEESYITYQEPLALPTNSQSLQLFSTEITNDLNHNFTQTADAVEMKVGDSFKDWDMVQNVVDSYAKWHGFVARKFRKDLDVSDKSVIRRYDYNCWKSGVNKPKK